MIFRACRIGIAALDDRRSPCGKSSMVWRRPLAVATATFGNVRWLGWAVPRGRMPDRQPVIMTVWPMCSWPNGYTSALPSLCGSRQCASPRCTSRSPANRPCRFYPAEDPNGFMKRLPLPVLGPGRRLDHPHPQVQSTALPRSGLLPPLSAVPP